MLFPLSGNFTWCVVSKTVVELTEAHFFGFPVVSAFILLMKLVVLGFESLIEAKVCQVWFFISRLNYLEGNMLEELKAGRVTCSMPHE